MGRDDKHASPDMDEDDDGESHAADEPTAVWDENALRAAGLGDIFKPRDEPPRPATTKSVVPEAPSIVVDESASQPIPVAKPATATPVPAAPSKGGLGWGATLGIAIALGAIAYAVIRLLRG